MNDNIPEKPSLLFISTQLPSMEIPQAGHKIAYSNLKAYTKAYSIYLISSVNEQEQKFLPGENLWFCKKTYFYSVDNFSRAFSLLTHPRQPIRASVKANRRAGRKIIELQKRVQFDSFHFEFTASAFYMDYIHQRAKKIFVEHDITYQAIERKIEVSTGIKKFLYSMEYYRQKKWELEKLHRADEIIVLNKKDKNILLNDGIQAKSIRILEPAIDPAFKNIQRKDIEKHSILFFGALNRKENVDAVLWFVHDIYPSVLKKFEDSKLYVIGANPPSKISKLNSNNVIITGFVNNPAKYFETCQVAIAPLRMGAGIKIKLLEYLAARLPIVATSVGAEGIEDDHIILRDDPGEFAKAIISLFIGE